MQQHSSCKQFAVAALDACDDERVAPHALQMGMIVRSVLLCRAIAVGRQGTKQGRRQRLKWGKGVRSVHPRNS